MTMWRWIADRLVPPAAVAVDPEHPLTEHVIDMIRRMLAEAVAEHYLDALLNGGYPER